MLQGGARAVVASPAADLPPSVIAEFSSTLTQKERGKLLKRFGAGKVKCLVCGLVAKDSSDSFSFSKRLLFSGFGKMGKFFKSFCPEMLQEVL